MPVFSVRSRILASILVVTAIGMTVAGGTAFLVQRDRTLHEIDDRLLSRVESARFVVTGAAAATGGDQTVPAAPGEASFTTTTEALNAVLEPLGLALTDEG